MYKTDNNHHTKPNNMILYLIPDDKATIIQPVPKTRYAHIVKGLITLLENVEFVLIAWILFISVMSAAPPGQVIRTEQIYASRGPRRQ